MTPAGCATPRRRILPFVELAVDEVLRLIGGRLGRERDELRDEVFRHALRQLVGDGQRLTSARRTNAQHLQYDALAQSTFR